MEVILGGKQINVIVNHKKIKNIYFRFDDLGNLCVNANKWITNKEILKLIGNGAVKRRIMDMGITKGTEIFVRKVAPLGDPIEIKVRGYELSLRKADAEMILIA